MALRTHNMPSGRLKNDFSEVDKAIFQGVERPRDIIFRITGTETSDFYEVS
jgi:hypothetical protein